MPISLTAEQSEAITRIQAFMHNDHLDAFVLRGSAGTGKTTLIAHLVQQLRAMNLSCALLAPTGRAARILGSKVRQQLKAADWNDDALACLSVSTIHGQIYSLKTIEIHEETSHASDPGMRMIFPLKQDEPLVSLLIIDESSMVGDQKTHGDFLQFGSGRLLRDVVTHARLRRADHAQQPLCKLLFVGDPAQLPPVGDNHSPALADDYLSQTFGLQVASLDMHTVLRQAADSAILERATTLRNSLQAGRFHTFSLQPNQRDIQEVDSATAVEMLHSHIQQRHPVVAIVHSNRSALFYNRTVRERRWGNADLPIQVGDILLVCRNSTPLSNGDLVKVLQVDEHAQAISVPLKGEKPVRLQFRRITVAFRGDDGQVIQLQKLVLENLLDSPSRELSPLEQRALLVHLRTRYPHLSTRSDELRQILQDDPYFNALHVKYGYAMTCHKAQGGEWPLVMVDFQRGNSGTNNADFFRWAYTAITRASQTLVIVNPPSFTATSTLAWERPLPNTAAETASTATTPHTADTLRNDPDWNRLCFSASTAALMPLHQQLRQSWAAQGIRIVQLQHLSYCERYSLERDGQQAQLQYHYNGKSRPSKATIVASHAPHTPWANDALAALQRAIQGTCGHATSAQTDTTSTEAFIQEFLVQLDTALTHSGIQRTAVRPLPYRLRITLSDGTRQGEIDFVYNNKQSWSTAQEVGGSGSSGGLYEQVQMLMAAASHPSDARKD